MANVLGLFTLVTMILVVHGAQFNYRHFFNRRNPFSEPKYPPPGGQNIVEGYVTQRIDNFNPFSETWQQRFAMNGEFWAPGGCIFILLTGNWELAPERLEEGKIHSLSQEFGCYMFQLEHRYYGQSQPTDDISTENLRFLNVEQALADIAHFIEHITSETVTPGAPELTSYSPRSPLRSSPTLSVVDHFQYKELAGAVYRHIGGNECYERLERGFAAMEQMVVDGQLEELTNMFQLCDPLEGTLDIQLLFVIISEVYSELIQYVQIDAVCDIILNEALNDAEAMAAILSFVEEECIPIDYELIIREERQTDWNSTAAQIGLRQWTYQSCFQLGWYHSSNSVWQPFGSSFPVEFMFQACADIFDELFSSERLLENSARFNTAFGGVAPQATNVLYIHGQLDPWRTVGVQSDDNESTNVIIIEGASQSSDIGPITEEDSDTVVEAKQAIIDTISGWIRASQETNKIQL